MISEKTYDDNRQPTHQKYSSIAVVGQSELLTWLLTFQFSNNSINQLRSNFERRLFPEIDLTLQINDGFRIQLGNYSRKTCQRKSISRSGSATRVQSRYCQCTDLSEHFREPFFGRNGQWSIKQNERRGLGSAGSSDRGERRREERHVSA